MSRPASTMVCTLIFAAGLASAEPLLPTNDAQVVETLAGDGNRAEERALRRRLAADPSNERVAVTLARRYIDAARALGDPRYAGRALAVLQAWPDPASAPSEVLLMRATVQQHLHDFDDAVVALDRLVARDPRHAQAWLTLATVRRVQGRYRESDAACDALAKSGQPLHALACRADNDGLLGKFDVARGTLGRLIAQAQDTATRGWLLTTLAELEVRAARHDAADAAYRAALAAGPDPYTALSYVDFLLARDRVDAALALLRDQPVSDAVLLRRAIASGNARSAEAHELRERFTRAAARGGSSAVHAREQAMFALCVEGDAPRALALARENIRRQREPLDLLVLAQAARAAGDAAALRETATLAREIGLHDLRLEALL